jgi:hypothetical protein
MESRRHNFVLCKSRKCEARFEKECLTLAEKECEVKVALRIKQEYSKKGTVHCPQCFFALKDVPLPACDVEEAADEPPPPPPCEETQVEAPCQGNPVDAIPELPDVDFSKCTLHMKETDPSPTNAKKSNKKGKKPQQQLQRNLVQALFFEDASPKNVTEEGEILKEEEEEVHIPIPSATSAEQSPPPTTAPIARDSLENWPSTWQWQTSWSSIAKAEPPASAAAAHAEVGKSKRPVGSAPLRQPASPVKSAASDMLVKSEKAVGGDKNVRSGLLSAARSEQPLELPQGWKQAWDNESNKHYYWNINTRETKWACPKETSPCKQDEIIPESSISTASTTCSTFTASSESSQATASQPSSRTTGTPANELRYVCTRSWVPRPDDASNCIRLTQGERIVLESETLSGWGIGTCGRGR